MRNADIADYLHVNSLKVLGPNRWFAAGSKRFDPENLLFDDRKASFIAIIDKKTGKIVWRLGRTIKPNAVDLSRHSQFFAASGLPY